ncbi:hypothetical protein IGI04_005571 [Brassica rapa subsp. trilocularis]|uniref:Uncharacterized protein n=1 Tax=Brassica rapa subsp. trilocularis TaxID=1813537 RepID=A0ABQ7NEC9_BRACM|nr:hypothetical protein IGI04_005571 [Brassica rapa subsp. trilocularis]
MVRASVHMIRIGVRFTQKWWRKNCSGGSASAAVAARRIVAMAMKEVAVMTVIMLF